MKQVGKFLGAISKSDIMLALVLLLVVDLVFRFGFRHSDQFQLGFDEPYRSRIWWAMKDFIAQPKTADVVLFGASDMTCAFYGAEATFLNTPQSQLLKHRSDYFEGKLAQLSSPFRTSFCLGIPGEMPSDAYFIANTILSHKRKPKAVCLSIAPRDFYDATFSDPTSTDIFKVANKLGMVRDGGPACKGSFWDECDRSMQKASSVYGHKWDLTSWQHHATHNILNVLLGQEYATIQTPQAIRKLALIQLPEDYASMEIMEPPYDPKHPVWLNNLAEYQSRYRCFSARTFKQQLAFLKGMGELCRSEGVGFLVVNSPLTNENRAMIQKSAYDTYMSEIPKAVRGCGGVFVNLDSSSTFQHDDFFDSIHLNGKGGQKFLDQIALSLSKTSELVAASARYLSSKNAY